jgi:tetratricopeptide (TPR) repeat protein
MHVLSLVREAQYDPPEEVIPDLPAKLNEILRRALAKDPVDRYQSAGEMLADVEEFAFELSLPPNARSFAQYMKELFEEEFAEEELALWAKSKIYEAGENEKESGQKPVPGTYDNTVILTKAFLNEKLKQFKQTIFTGVWQQLAKVLRIKKQNSAEKKNHDQKSTRPGFKFAVLKPGMVVLAFLLVVALGIKQISFSRSQPEDTSYSYLSTTVEEPVEISKLAAGKAALEAKRYTLAATLFDEIIASDPSMMKDLSEFYVQASLGQAVDLIGTDSEQAKKFLLKALEIDPGNISGLSNLGYIYMGRKNYPKAIETYLKVADLAPRLPDTFFNLGYVYAVTENYQQAKKMYRRVVELNPAFTDEALFNIAVINEKLGEHKQCIKNLEQAVALNPANESAKKYLRQLKKKTGDKKG